MLSVSPEKHSRRIFSGSWRGFGTKLDWRAARSLRSGRCSYSIRHRVVWVRTKYLRTWGSVLCTTTSKIESTVTQTKPNNLKQPLKSKLLFQGPQTKLSRFLFHPRLHSFVVISRQRHLYNVGDLRPSSLNVNDRDWSSNSPPVLVALRPRETYPSYFVPNLSTNRLLCAPIDQVRERRCFPPCVELRC